MPDTALPKTALKSISLENNRIKLVIASGKGADIVEILHRRKGRRLYVAFLQRTAAYAVTQAAKRRREEALYRYLCGEGGGAFPNLWSACGLVMEPKLEFMVKRVFTPWECWIIEDKAEKSVVALHGKG